MLQHKCGRWLASVAILAAGVGCGQAVAAPQVVVNGQPIPSASVLIIGGHAMVPVREVFQRIPGAAVRYDGPHKRLILSHGDRQVRLHLYSGYAHVRGEGIPMDVPVVTRDGKALMPLRSVAALIGARVRYTGQRILVTSGPPETRVAGYRGPDWALSEARRGHLALGGVRLLRLQTAGEYQSLEERVSRVTERLTASIPGAMRQGRLQYWRIRLGEREGDPMIYVGDRGVLRVTDEDAQRQGISKQQLAEEWLRQIRTGLERIYGDG